MKYLVLLTLFAFISCSDNDSPFTLGEAYYVQLSNQPNTRLDEHFRPSGKVKILKMGPGPWIKVEMVYHTEPKAFYLNTRHIVAISQHNPNPIKKSVSKTP